MEATETHKAALLINELLRVLAKRNPEPAVMLSSVGAIFASYCRDAKEDPVTTFRSVTEGTVGLALARIMDGRHA